MDAASGGAGTGSTFTLAFPLLTVQQGSGAGPTWPGATPRLDGIRVLVVDDDADAPHLVTMVLERAGATVVAVGTAAEVLATVQQRELDILVADIGLPEEDGYSLMSKICQQATRVARVPAVAGVEHRARAFLAGGRIRSVRQPPSVRDADHARALNQHRRV